MTIGELVRYLPYAPNQNQDVVLLDRKTYEYLLRTAKTLDAIKEDLRRVYKTVEKVK